MLAVALFIAAAPAVVVVHDGSAREAQVAAAHLIASGKVSATLRDAPLAASCVRTTACPDRPAADALLVVSTTPGSPAKPSTSVRLELVDKSGATLAVEAVDVADAALLDATLAPALDRIADAAVHASAPAGAAAPAKASADEGGGWMPWVLGAAGVCGGLCALGLGAGLIYSVVAGANAAGTAVGNACVDAACTQPLAGLGDACNGIGDLGNACSGVGDGLGNACDGLGNIGSCAVMPMGPLALALRPPDETSAPPPTAGAMRY